MALSPVMQATDYIIRLNRQAGCESSEGLGLCSRLIAWISCADVSDYHEAAMLTFFLARTMQQHNVISAHRFHLITDEAATVIQQACASRMDRAMAEFLSDRGYVCQATSDLQGACPSTEALTRIATLKASEAPSGQDKVELFDLFERLLRWASVTPQESFYQHTHATSVFLTVEHMLSKGVITQDEKDKMFQRAFQVFVRFPDHNILDDDLVDFLHINLNFEIRKNTVKKSPDKATLKYMQDLDNYSLFQLADPRFRKEGLKHYSKNAQWISRINRNNYESVAEQTFALVDVMREKKIISKNRAAQLVDETGRMILDVLGTKMSSAMSMLLSQRELKTAY
jgi:hypothetical protein